MKRLLILLFFLSTLISKADYWTQKANFPGGARFWAASFAIGSKGYVGTGVIGNVYFNDFWEYDQLTNSWTQKSNFGGAARQGAAGFSIGNKGYFVTGWDGIGFSLSSYHNDLWEYDQATDTWTQKASMLGIGRANPMALSVASKGFVGLGLSASWNYQNDFWEYDPISNSWIQRSNFNKSVVVPTGFTIGTKCYVGGGNNLTTFYSDIWEWNSITDTWTQMANIPPIPRCDGSAFTINGIGYYGIGGSTNNAKLKDFWQYDPLLNQWTQKTDFGGGYRRSASSFTINNKGYIALGTDSFTYFYNDLWEYTPDSVTNAQEINKKYLSINIFPNPVKEKLNVTANNKEVSEITLYDIELRKILEQKFTSSISLNTEQLAKGIYIYEVRDKNGIVKKGKVAKD